MNRTLLLLLLTFFSYATNYAATATATTTGNWSGAGATTWTGGGGTGGAPLATDDILIPSGVTLTINVSDAICNSVSFGATSSKLAFSSATSKLSITGNFTFFSTSHDAFGTWTAGAEIDFVGTSAQSIANTSASSTWAKMVLNNPAGVSFSSNGHFVFTDIILTTGTFTLPSGNDVRGSSSTASITINGGTWSQTGSSTKIRVGSTGSNPIGTVTINGGTMNFATSSGTGFNFTNLILSNGAILSEAAGASGNVTVSNSVDLGAGTLWKHGASGTLVFPATVTLNGTMEFNNGSSQTIPAATYTNLKISTSSTKTPASGVIVNGILTLAGTSTLGGAVTWGSNSTLEYNGTSNQTTGTNPNEWPSANGPKNLIISNSATSVTLNATGGRTITGTLTLQSANFIQTTPLTLGTGVTIERIAGTIAAAPVFGSSVNLIYSGSVGVTTGPELPTSNTVLNNLTITNTGDVILGANASVNGTLSVTGAGVVLDADGSANDKVFTLRSTATNTARVGEGIATGGYITGKVTVQRFIGAPAAKQAWRLLTAPLKSSTGADVSIFSTWQNGGVDADGVGTYVTGPNPVLGDGIDANTPGSSLKTFNGSTLDGVTNTNDAVLLKNTAAGTPGNNSYFVFITGDRNATVKPPTANSRTTTLSATGNLQTGPQTFTTNTGSQANTLIGNPYASPVDFELLYSQNPGAQIKRTFYFWDPNLAGLYNVGGYVVVSSADGGLTYTTAPWNTPGPAGGTVSNANYTRFIQSGQAIFLENNTGAAGGQALIFQESQKSSTSSINEVFRTSAGKETFRVNLKTIEGASAFLTDGVVAEFASNFAGGVDDIDASKFYNINEGVAFIRNNIALAIERRPTIQLKDTLFLNMKNLNAGSNYRFSFDGDFTSPGMVAFLQDKTNPGVNTPVSVMGNTTYDFSVTANPATSAPDRFRIVFAATGPLPLTLTNVKAYQQNSNIAVEWKTENESRMKQYEVEKSVTGADFARVSTVAAQNTLAATYNWLDVNAVSGNNYYRIRSVSLDGEVKYSKVVKVFIGKGDAVISVYPNPVIDGVINLQLTNMAKGNYTINLINNIGQVVQSQKVSHSGGSATETISISKSVPRGTYQLEIVSPDNSRITNQLIY